MSRQDRQRRRDEQSTDVAPLPSMKPPVGRRLSRTETHDLSMIIKDRTRVLKAHAEEQAAVRMAEFEQKMASIYKWDQDEVWAKAAEEAAKVVVDAQKKIEERAKELGIPVHSSRLASSSSGAAAGRTRCAAAATSFAGWRRRRSTR